MHKTKPNFFKSFTNEEIQAYADGLEDDQLELFVKEIEKANLELEERVNKKIVIEKNKKSNLKLVLKRIWLHLNEEEREAMAGLFRELENK